jgi:enoyl-[acyl-carrier-protein] reductase (NADH)
MNAADDEKRADALEQLKARFEASKAAGREPYVRVVMHSLAFGSLVPFISDDPKGAVDRKKMEMTQDVMANSLVYWVQDLYRGGFLGQGSKIYAMTSEGSTAVVPSYGVVSSPRPRSNRTSASWRWSSRASGPASPRTRSAPA